jgi:hypothetical protein
MPLSRTTLGIMQRIVTLSVQVMLSVNYAECHVQALNAECRGAECRYAKCSFAECHYAECRYAECLYAECRYAECRSAVFLLLPPFCCSREENKTSLLVSVLV